MKIFTQGRPKIRVDRATARDATTKEAPNEAYLGGRGLEKIVIN